MTLTSSSQHRHRTLRRTNSSDTYSQSASLDGSDTWDDGEDEDEDMWVSEMKEFNRQHSPVPPKHGWKPQMGSVVFEMGQDEVGVDATEATVEETLSDEGGEDNGNSSERTDAEQSKTYFFPSIFW